MASKFLLSLLVDGSAHLSTLRNELVTRTCGALLESPSPQLRTHGAMLLAQLIRDAAQLGNIARKSMKSHAKRMLTSSCHAEAVAGAALLSVLISYAPAGELQSVEKFVSSWVRICDGFPDLPEITSEILCASPLLSKYPAKVLREVFKEHNLSLAIVPDSKKRIWRLEDPQFRRILALLKSRLGSIKDIGRVVLDVCGAEHFEAAYEWYYQSAVDGKFLLSESELQRLPLLISNVPLLWILHCNYFPRVINSGHLQSKMMASLFAQLKGDCALLHAGEEELISIESIQALALSLSCIISSSSFDSEALDSLYLSHDLLQNIRDWALDLAALSPQSWAASAAAAILGAIHRVRPSSVSAAVTEILQRSGQGLQKGIAYLLYFAKISSSSGSLGEAAASACVEQLRIISELPLGEAMHILPFILGTPLVETPQVRDVAAPLAVKLICSGSTSDFLFAQCQEILVRYFTSASVASQKYYLSHLKAFISSSTLQSRIFQTIIALLQVITFEDKGKEDIEFILGVLKTTIFPFVCDQDIDLQRLAASGLGSLVSVVNTAEFQDGMLQELIDRSLNEPKETHRRGYIFGIAEVAGAILQAPGSRLDITSIVGILSSLAKDSRSITVQSAALGSLHRVLDQQSNAMTPLLSSDMVYLIWQVYMTESSAAPAETAVENALLDSISHALLVLIELLGPLLRSPCTISRICTLMVGELVEHHSTNIRMRRTLVRASVQIILLRHEVECLSSLLALLKAMLDEGDIQDIDTAVSCLRWLFEYQREALMARLSNTLTASILNLYHGHASGDLDYCVESIFSSRFVNDPLFWIALMQNSRYLSQQASRTVELHVSMDSEMRLINESTASLKVDEACDGLEFVEPLEKLSTLICKRLAVDAATLIHQWSTDITSSFIADIIRLSLSLVMSRNPIYSHRLKLAGVGMIHRLTETFGQISDFIDKEGTLLDPCVSQIATIYSTACQDDDPIVAAHAFYSLSNLFIQRGRFECLRSHPKMRALISKKMEAIAAAKDDPLPSEPAELFGLILVLQRLVRIDESDIASTFRAVLPQRARGCVAQAVSMWRNDLLHPLIAREMPHLVPICEFRKSDALVATGALAILVALEPSPVLHQALSRILPWCEASLSPPVTTNVLQRSIEKGDVACLVSVLENLALFEKVASREAILLAVLWRISEDGSEVGPLSAAIQLSEAEKELVWPITATILYKAIRSGLEASTVLSIVRTFVGEASHCGDLLSLVFRSDQSDRWKLQYSLGYLEAMTLTQEGSSQLIIRASALLRSVVATDRDEGLSLWRMFSESKSSPARTVAANTIDGVLEGGPLESIAGLADLVQKLPTNAAKCVWQLSSLVI